MTIQCKDNPTKKKAEHDFLLLVACKKDWANCKNGYNTVQESADETQKMWGHNTKKFRKNIRKDGQSILWCRRCITMTVRTCKKARIQYRNGRAKSLLPFNPSVLKGGLRSQL